MAEWACGDRRPWALLVGVPALPLSPLFWVAHRPCHSFLLHPSILWTKPSPISAWRKPITFPLQVWQPLHIWLAWGSLRFMFSFPMDWREKCVSKWLVLPWQVSMSKQNPVSDIGLTCFSPHLLLTLPASEHLSWVEESPIRVLEAEPSLPLIKFKSPNACSPCPELGQSMLGFQSRANDAKRQNSELSCQWSWQWPCAMSVNRGSGGREFIEMILYIVKS